MTLKSLVFGFSTLASLCVAQQSPNPAGRYDGILANHSVHLNITVGAGGTIGCTADNPEQNMMGLPCSNVVLKGQALSFSIPAAQGSWAGFVSADGASLLGTWNQGSPSPLNFTRASSDSPTIANGPKDVKWDNYTYKFNGYGVAGIYEGDKLVGRILPTSGDRQVVVFPGNEAAKIKQSYADYQAFAARTNGGTAPPPVPPSHAADPPSTPAPRSPQCTAAAFQAAEGDETPGTVTFDDASHLVTVSRKDGVTVVFGDQDSKITCGPLTYTLRKQKGSAGRMLESSILHPKNNGGSITGGGVEFLMNGSLLYDSGMGHYGDMQTDPKLRTVKHISLVAVSAVDDVRKMDGHQKFTPPGYDTLKEIAQYRLRSNGSR